MGQLCTDQPVAPPRRAPPFQARDGTEPRGLGALETDRPALYRSGPDCKLDGHHSHRRRQWGTVAGAFTLTGDGSFRDRTGLSAAEFVEDALKSHLSARAQYGA